MANQQNIEPHKFKKNDPRINRKGRPVGSKSRKNLVMDVLSMKETVKHPITKEEVKLSQAEIITLKMLDMARKGDIKAWKELMDSAYGKNPDNVINVNIDAMSDEEIEEQVKRIRGLEGNT